MHPTYRKPIRSAKIKSHTRGGAEESLAPQLFWYAQARQALERDARLGSNIMEKLSVDIQNLPDQFDELLAQAQSGHEIIVRNSRQPRAILTPIAPDSPWTQATQEIKVSFLGEPRTIAIPAASPHFANQKRRIPSLGIGIMKILTAFDDPLPDKFWLGESS